MKIGKITTVVIALVLVTYQSVFAYSTSNNQLGQSLLSFSNDNHIDSEIWSDKADQEIIVKSDGISSDEEPGQTTPVQKMQN